MKTYTVEGKNYRIPEQWEDLTFAEYIQYCKIVAKNGNISSVFGMFDVANDDPNASTVFEKIEKPSGLIGSLQFVLEPPKYYVPKKIQVGELEIEIKLPVRIKSQAQFKDLQDSVFGASSVEEAIETDCIIEQFSRATLFCSIYCQTLVYPNYLKDEALKFVPLFEKANAIHVLNLGMCILAAVTAKSIFKKGLDEARSN